jgi:hypothetical protein
MAIRQLLMLRFAKTTNHPKPHEKQRLKTIAKLPIFDQIQTNNPAALIPEHRKSAPTKKNAPTKKTPLNPQTDMRQIARVSDTKRGIS